MAVRRRARVALLAGALVAPFIAVGQAAATPPDPPAPQSINDFCEEVPEDFRPFIDINGNFHEQAIICAAFADIAKGGPQGRSSDRYGPELLTRRDQMASFIVRLIDKANELESGENNIRDLPDYDGTPAFTDIGPGNTHFQAVNRLEQVDIVRGGPRGRPMTEYGPELPVSRGQMASFINRSVEFMTGQAFTTPNDYFTDDTGFTHERNINGVASRGIAVGDGVDDFDPLRDILRDQIASFLVRTLAVLEADGRILPLGQDGGRPDPEPEPEPTENISVTPDEAQTLDAVENPDDDDSDDRTYSVSGLIEGEEYRVTLVDDDLISNEGSDNPVFTDNEGDDNLAETGRPEADIVAVDGMAPRNNTGDGSDLTTNDPDMSGTVVFVAPEDGTVTVTIDGDVNGEDVRPVAYRNGGGDNDASDGGDSPRLELNDDGTAAEPVDVGGVTRFVEDDQQPVEGEATVNVEDGTVMPGDAVMATITGDQPVASVTVSGPCVETQTFTEDGNDNDADGFQVSVQIRDDAAEGDCVLTFETTFENGTTDTDTATVTVEDGGEPQPVEGEATVEVEDSTVMAGDEVIATITGNVPVESVRVTGDCVDTQTFTTDEDPDAEGFQVSVQIRENTPSGDCVLTFETTFENGTTDTDTATVTVTANEGTANAEAQDGLVVAGDAAMATITANDPRTVETVTVSGDCVTTQTFTTDGDADTDGFEVRFDTREDAAEGPCELTFEVTFDNGDTDTTTATIDIQQQPLISDAVVATDAGQATASAGDFFELTFNEEIATDSANATDSATATLTAQSANGDEFVIDCGGDPMNTNDGLTAATCTIDGVQLTIELLEDPEQTGAGGDNTFPFPLLITEIDGITDTEGNPVDLQDSPDRTIDEESGSA